ncbi:MAG: DnaJ domain-containing protein, partial [Chitinophaga rupis]
MDYKKDYYKILGVDNKATTEELRASYRRLAKLHHPDKNPGDPDAEERCKSINEAYETLSNEITRHIYDSYRASNENINQQQEAEENDNSANSHGPFRRKKKRTYTVTREKRVYVHGIIEVKFQGEPELSGHWQWEQRFTVFPTEVLVTIVSSDIYKDGPPKEYQQGYSDAELFTTPIKQPINCKIVTAGQEQYYELELNDIRIRDVKLMDVTRHEPFSFGTLLGSLFGYVLYQYEEEETEEFNEFYGPTGHVETKTESDYIFTRQQFYATDGSTYWAEWKRGLVYKGKYQRRKEEAKPIFRNEIHRGSDWSPVSGILTIVLIILLIARIWPHGSGLVLRPSSNKAFDSVSSKSTVFQGPD